MDLSGDVFVANNAGGGAKSNLVLYYSQFTLTEYLVYYGQNHTTAYDQYSSVVEISTNGATRTVGGGHNFNWSWCAVDPSDNAYVVNGLQPIDEISSSGNARPQQRHVHSGWYVQCCGNSLHR